MVLMSNYRVWAPYASEVRLLLGNPDAPAIFDMHPIADATHGYGANSGWFEADVARTPGDRYAFSLRAHAGYGAPDGESGTAPPPLSATGQYRCPIRVPSPSQMARMVSPRLST